MRKTLSAALLLALVTAAHATWHPITEGEGGWADFDDPAAGQPYSIFPAGIYEPAPYFMGSVGSPADTSDTLLLRLWPGFLWTDLRIVTGSRAAPGIGGDTSLTLENSSAASLVSVALTPPGSVNVTGLSLGPDLYTLRIQTAGSSFSYALGFTLLAVPEPAMWANLLLGIGLVAMRRHQRTARREA